MRSEGVSVRGKPSFRGLPVFALCALLLCGCSTPIGVTKLGERSAYRQIAGSALSTGAYSSFTASVLHRYNLQDSFDKSPLESIRKLHEIATGDDRRDALFALSELCYLRADKAPREKTPKEVVTKRGYYMASAVYAYLYLLGDGPGAAPSPYDRRFRMACDFYNRSLAPALIDENGQIMMGFGVFDLPAGRIRLALPDVDMSEYGKFVSADSYRVHGLSVRDRSAGLGAPIIAVRRKTLLRPYPAGLAVTVFMRVKGGLGEMTGLQLAGSIEVFSALEQGAVEVDGKLIPLERDQSTQLAYTLDNPILWKFGKKLFLSEDRPIKPGLYATQPYAPGKIPVVFVHGTMSSPIWWAEMLNTLRSDPAIREKFQFAFYLYDSGKPITFSALHMRETIRDHVRKVDAFDSDRTMNEMVLVGHSQGGLLIKLAVTDTEEKLLRIYFDRPLSEIDMTSKERELIRRYTCFKPLPFISRVIFISTPHRGSYLASGFARRLARRFMRLPKDVMDTGGTLLGIAEKHNVPKELLSGIPTSVDSMSPGNPTLLALAEMPPAEGVKSHSIVAIKGDDKPPEGKDGVVEYKSAHLDYADSELVVRSGHSSQQHPVTIEEVRRILLLHVDGLAGLQCR